MRMVHFNDLAKLTDNNKVLSFRRLKTTFFVNFFVSQWFVTKFQFVFISRNDSKRNSTGFFLFRRMIRKGISSVFCFVERNFLYILVSQWFVKKVPIPFCFTKWFETDFRMFMFRWNRRNSDEMGVRHVFREINILTKNGNPNCSPTRRDGETGSY